MTTGRPSKYLEIYCDTIVAHMENGASIASFAASIGVARSTVQEWEAVHSGFSVAVKIGKAKCAAWWEDRLRSIAVSGGATGQAAATIFGLKNMASEDWREKVENTVTGPLGAPLFPEPCSPTEIAKVLLLLLERANGRDVLDIDCQQPPALISRC